jgi:hypothetical protein
MAGLVAMLRSDSIQERITRDVLSENEQVAKQCAKKKSVNQTNGVFVSFTPGFNRVSGLVKKGRNRFNGPWSPRVENR